MAFIFDANKGETPQSLSRRRAIVDSLLTQDQGTPRNVGEGISAIGKALGGYFAGKALHKKEMQFQSGADARWNEIAATLQGPGAFPPAPDLAAPPGQSPEVNYASSRAAPANGDMNGNAVFDGFMKTVRDGGVTNPYALAAIAATGKHESAFSPENVSRTWSDPSQSGQPGTSGGIMSWRDDRLANMQRFAQQNGGQATPEIQAQFFLQENPQLITQLQTAQSPEEAQRLMNNAWKFAGYDQPGGEAGARIQTALSLADQFGAPDTVQPGGNADPVSDPFNSDTLGARPIPQGGPDLQMLLQAAGDPWMNDNRRAIVSELLAQQMGSRDPLRQLQLEKGRIELDNLRKTGGGEFKVVGDRLMRVGGDGNVTDVTPQSGDRTDQFRFDGKSVEAQSLNGLMDSGILTPEQAQQLGAGKTVSGPNGEIMFLTPQGVFGQSSQGGPPQPVTADGRTPATPPVAGPNTARPGMIPLTEPKSTIDERKAAGFADRMTQSGELLNTYGNAGLGVKDQFIRGNDYVPDFMKNWLVSGDFQNFDQARRDFINAQLRRESGAVISDEEFDNANKQYFPQPGDTTSVIEQKRRNRETVINGMIRDAGPTYQNEGSSDIPAGAIEMLKANPDLADQFDQKYGPGSSARILGAR